MIWPAIMFFVLLVICATPVLSETQLESLRREHAQVEKEIANANTEHDRFSGGLVKSLLHARLELLRTNSALIEQRIHALEAGVKIRIVIDGTKPDMNRTMELEKEVKALDKKIAEQQAESERYSGGLVKAMMESGIATSRMSRAMLQTEYLKAKYGIRWLPSLKRKSAATSIGSTQTRLRSKSSKGPEIPKRAEKDESARVLIPKPRNKRFQPADWRNRVYDDAIWFDIIWDTSNLKKPLRAVKGILVFADLFGEPRYRVKLTINEPLEPGRQFSQTGIGFNYNQFSEEHRWMRSTEFADMTFRFEVQELLYEDGTRTKFERGALSRRTR